jgi:hypothetical protein
MQSSRHTNAGDEVAEILDLLARLRSRLKDAGPMLTSRVWKAEMQMKNLAADLPAGVTPLHSPKKLAREAVRLNAVRMGRLCLHPRSQHLNNPPATVTPIRPQSPVG